ncbi:hypothetical protein CIPAW_10G125400 [Carya illinoinensis]|uniref:Uncharacterized protein n=1 Tax=Carya illinoinensis TaxID=32201 RepID=A0A8T1P5C7_CARIL|nr:hypothetical protein CIPAW_10G125400 [Carya illinoinensis]
MSNRLYRTVHPGSNPGTRSSPSPPWGSLKPVSSSELMSNITGMESIENILSQKQNRHLGFPKQNRISHALSWVDKDFPRKSHSTKKNKHEKTKLCTKNLEEKI